MLLFKRKFASKFNFELEFKQKRDKWNDPLKFYKWSHFYYTKWSFDGYKRNMVNIGGRVKIGNRKWGNADGF